MTVYRWDEGHSYYFYIRVPQDFKQDRIHKKKKERKRKTEKWGNFNYSGRQNRSMQKLRLSNGPSY